jgi:hypothetical protein
MEASMEVPRPPQSGWLLWMALSGMAVPSALSQPVELPVPWSVWPALPEMAA